MSIDKASASTLRHEGVGYTVLITDVINTLQHAESLAIWTYLQSKPTNWVIRKTDLMNRLHIGKTRYQTAMNELKAIGLIEAIPNQNEAGHFTGSTLICRQRPKNE